MTLPIWRGRSSKFISRTDEKWVPSGRLILFTTDGTISSIFEDSPFSILRELTTDGIISSEFLDLGLHVFLLATTDGTVTSNFEATPIQILREMDTDGIISSNFGAVDLILARDLLARYIFHHPKVEQTFSHPKVFSKISEVVDPQYVFNKVQPGDLIVVHNKVSRIFKVIKVKNRR